MRPPVSLLPLLLAGCTQFQLNSVDQPATIDIIRPTNGSVFDPTEPVPLCLLVADDGGIDDVTLVVDSSLDGTVVTVDDPWGSCEGGNVAFDLDLSAGVHLLTVTGRDEAAHVTTATVTIGASTDAPPSCTVTAPLPGSRFPLGSPIEITAKVTDAETPPDTLATLLDSSLDGTLWEGTADSSGDLTHVTSTLTEGSHYISLLVTDDRGQTDLCGVALQVDPCTDDDGDGVSSCEGDCDDDDPLANPSGTETANGRDDDCDGTTDEGTVLYDDDGDGLNELQGDCDDADPGVSPVATEIVDDGIDQDCSGTDSITCFTDADLDGHGVSPAISSPDGDCKDPGEAPASDDCDDADGTTFPGAFDTPDDGVDQDCSGADTVSCQEDSDEDGWGGAALVYAADGDCDDVGEADTSTDCDDDDETRNPGVTEVRDDGIDQDCSGADTVSCFQDLDKDRRGSKTVIDGPDGDCLDAGESTFSDDCDDADPARFPGAAEIAGNGIDENCDGSDAATCYVDDDKDGFGDDGRPTFEAPDGDCDDPGEASVGGDCDDGDPTANPNGTELVDDDIDQDCNGADDVTCWTDKDGDSWGVAPAIIAHDGACDDSGEAPDKGDCDDTNDKLHPGATEIVADGIDQDCSGTDTIRCQQDADRDGHGGTTIIEARDGDCDDPGESLTSDDCDDVDRTRNPSATEAPDDGVDHDCNGYDGTICFTDSDGDSWGVSSTRFSADDDCADSGEADDTLDCDDSKANVHPGAAETPDDGIDQDCSGQDAITCAKDADADGFGGSDTVVSADEDCSDSGESARSDDCDDSAGDVYPGAEEQPGNGIDENCDGTDAAICYVDSDGDDFGSSQTLEAADGDCDDPGESATGGDCNDSNAAIYPGAIDTPDDGTDQDCSGSDTITCQVDADGDGVGGSSTRIADDGNCTDPGEARSDDDCDDGNADVYPSATEVPDNGVDEDCSGADTVTCQADTDGDGHGSSDTQLAADGDCNDSGESSTSDDCAPDDAAIYPGATETPGDGIDQDCNGTDSASCYVDSDGDGYGDGALLSDDADCTDVGETDLSGDCDDSDDSIYPGAPEVPGDGIDQDCSGDGGNSCYRDLDGDGFGGTDTITSDDGDCADPGEAPLSNDCDDTDPDLNPDAVDDSGNGIDENCDGLDGVDEDGDGVASEDSGGDDCNDTLATAYPGADEVRDGYDNDCNAQCDEGLINPGDLVISEIHFDPTAVHDSRGEWFEVHNPTNIDIRLCLGWTLRDDDVDSHDLPAGTEVLVRSQGYAVLGKSDNPALNGGVNDVWAYGGNMALSNSSDEVALEHGGLLIDHVAYTGSWPGTSGKSMQLSPSSLDANLNDASTSWCTSTSPFGAGDKGTPGKANDGC